MEIQVSGQKINPGKSKLTIVRDGEKLHEETLELGSGNFSLTRNVFIEAKKAGMQQLRVSIDAVPGEVSQLNNVKTVFIEVLDARNKVKIFGLSPHPDIGALKQAIESNKNYEVEVEYAFQIGQPDLSNVNLLILHRLPQYDYPLTSILDQVAKANVPVLFVVDESVYSNALVKYQPAFGYQARRGEINESLPAWNKSFSLFDLSESTREVLELMPPIHSPYARYQEFPANRVLAHQQIGAIKTEQPLIAFAQNAEQKTGVVYGTGFWRWRMYEYERNQNKDATNELINRIVQFLSVRENKTPFRVKTTQKNFNENEEVQFEAQLYNKAFQLTVEPDVQLVIKDQEGKEYSYTMGRSLNQYRLDAGYLKPGDYTYSASTSFDGNQYRATGAFIIKPLQLETLNTTARHDLLQQLSQKSGGTFAIGKDYKKLVEQIKNNANFQSVSYFKSSFLDFIELQWFFWVFLAFISTEWVIRKLKGAY